MAHWVKSFAVMALAALAFALGASSRGIGATPYAAAAVGVALLFLALAALALITGAMGRGRDGTYSGERAVWLVVGAIAGVLLADFATKDPALGTRVAEITQSLIPKT
jgi:hypothetical protein